MNRIRQRLPKEEWQAFDDIVMQRVLGASRHIQMIGEMFKSIAKEGVKKQRSVIEVCDDIKAVAQYFIATRGEASQAVSNAILIMINDIDEIRGLSLEEAKSNICEKVDAYQKKSRKDIELVVEYGARLGQKMNRIMVFDYSSTVDAFLRRLGEAKCSMEVIIPESRSINGGYDFVGACKEAGLKIHFIPDAAMMYYLRDCQGVFIGAETFYADGTAFNTTGSDIAGLLCKEFSVPLYVLTPMVKLDSRPIQGFVRDAVINDLKERMSGAGFKDEELDEVDFACPELLPVSKEHIHAYVTEYGVIPVNGMFSVCAEYKKNYMKG
ncbi:MAG TPA: hypothetical protein IAC62_11980 [Candidatus Pelethocola excrementipullorum]|nr:hypothetical protein [Candidatus Pelethocola excrementipullorum]